MLEVTEGVGGKGGGGRGGKIQPLFVILPFSVGIGDTFLLGT